MVHYLLSDLTNKEKEILQTIFSNGYIGLKKQGWKKSKKVAESENDTTYCVYLNAYGHKCIIGHSISSGKYVNEIEDCTFYGLLDPDQNLKNNILLETLNIPSGCSKSLLFFLKNLQQIHDRTNEDDLQITLKEYAVSHQLEIPDHNYEIAYL